MTKNSYTWGIRYEIVAGRSNQHTCSKVILPLILAQKRKTYPPFKAIISMKAGIDLGRRGAIEQ